MGCSRNAVIGKTHRLELAPARYKQPNRGAERKPKAAPRVVERKPIHRIRHMGGGLRVISTMTGDLFEPRCVELAPRNLTLMELEANDCRYIAGNDLLYCAHPQLPGSSYCPNHHRLVWRKPEPPKPAYVREAA